MTQKIELYKIGFSKEFEEALKRPKKPTLVIKFNSDEDMLDFFINHIAFISDEEKSKFTVDLQNIIDEDQFGTKLVEVHESRIKSKGD